MVTLTSAGLFFYQGLIVCSGLFNILSSPNEMTENASGSLSPCITDHLGFTIFISCINFHLPMGKKRASDEKNIKSFSPCMLYPLLKNREKNACAKIQEETLIPAVIQRSV